MPFTRTWQTLSAMGWCNGSLYLVARALQRATGSRVRLLRYHLVAQPVPRVSAAAPGGASRTQVRRVAAADPIVRQFPRPQPVIDRRFEVGATCFVAQRDERFAGFLWIARGGYDEDEVRCRYELQDPRDCVWDFDVYVEPEFRAGRSFAALWASANRYLDGHGVRWSVSRISAFNPGSLAAHKRLGIRKLHTATFVCAGNLQLALFGRAPFVHLSFSERSRPVLRLECPRT